MNAINQTVSLFFTITLLVWSGWYFAHLQPVTILDNETLSSTIDASVYQLSVQQYNEQGLLSNVLKTPLMQHIPKDDIHLLQNPHIIITQGTQPAWDIQALRAKSFNNGDHITFMEKVIVHQNASDTTQESTLKTEEVTYYPKQKKASTDLFVTFEQPGNIMQSMGMNAYLEEKRVELLHQARGSYDPVKG